MTKITVKNSSGQRMASIHSGKTNDLYNVLDDMIAEGNVQRIQQTDDETVVFLKDANVA